jgi:hypothetical protein
LTRQLASDNLDAVRALVAPLTPREREVFEPVIPGKTSQQGAPRSPSRPGVSVGDKSKVLPVRVNPIPL